MSSLDLRHLDTLRAVAATGSFGKAAESLGYSQSAVSQQVAALEKVVGQPVFHRPGGPRAVTLTPAGELLLERSEQIVDLVSTTLADLDQLRTGERGRVRIGTFQSVSEHIVPPILGRLREERPHVEADLFESDDVEELQRRLHSGDLDMSFLVAGSVEIDDDLEVLPLFSEPYLVLAAADEPPGDFRPTCFTERDVIGQHDYICQRLITAGLHDMGVEVDYAFHTTDNGAVHAMVRNGMGIAIMPRLAIDHHDPGISVHSLDPPLPDRHVLLCWRSGTPGQLIPAIAELARKIVAELGLSPASESTG